MANELATPSPTRRTVPRKALLTAAVTVMAVVLSGCWSPNQDKELGYINRARQQHGKAALNGDADLMAKAQAWSDHMSRSGRLEHTGGGSRLNTSGIHNWCGVAENVAVAGSTWEAHDALMKSPPHKVNVVGNFDRIGTGVTRRGDRVWVTEIYVRSC